jgi:hypothetical protein
MRINSKAVRQQVKQHAIDCYSEYGDTEQEAIDKILNDLEAVKYGNVSNYEAACKMVEGGQFLFYNNDVRDFLNGLGINPDNKEYPAHRTFELYCLLVAREIEKLAD